MISKELNELVFAVYGRQLLTLVLIILFSFLLPQPTWYQAWLLYSIIIVSINYKQLALLKTFKQLLFIGVILLIFYNINKYILFGTLLLIIALILYRLIKDMRKDKTKESIYYTGVRDIESRLFGKPLDKNLWRKK